jgi:uncharacterized membrane protein YtjA (UPF0391 family)
MLKWTLVLLAVSVLTGITGFSRCGSTLAAFARAFFFITVAVLLVIGVLNLFAIQ